MDVFMSEIEYSIIADGLANYSLACEMARDGHEGLREWFTRPAIVRCRSCGDDVRVVAAAPIRGGTGVLCGRCIND